MDDILGCLITATAGRDNGRIFVVVSRVDNNYYLIADGKYRRIEKPKKKKLRHIKVIVDADIDILQPLDVKENITNKQLREKINSYEIHMKDRL
ncbi:MAG: hypothetical protein A2Y17_06800 [Clostridiales bacterium GWF2_38_85]|nr:MAG: hypothetical protein A2Y17_06800 [Clostridiales bacterium GWF2_38_85]HBL84924.1 RNA-binding protein [Clostridiales bacterium]